MTSNGAQKLDRRGCRHERVVGEPLLGPVLAGARREAAHLTSARLKRCLSVASFRRFHPTNLAEKAVKAALGGSHRPFCRRTAS